MQSPPFAHTMPALQQVYVERIGSHMEFLEHVQRRMREIMPTREDMLRFQRIVHHFAGSGDMFGFPTVSATAAKLHYVLREALEETSFAFQMQPVPEALRLAAQQFVKACQSVLDAQAPGAHLSQDRAAFQWLADASKIVVLFAAQMSYISPIAEELDHFGYTPLVHTDLKAFMQADGEGAPPHAIILHHSIFALHSEKEVTEGLARMNQKAPVLLVDEKDDFASRLRVLRLGVQGSFNASVDILNLIDRIEQLATHPLTPTHHVLLVTEDAALVEFCRQALQAASVKLVALHAPDDALSHLEQQKCDILLVDAVLSACSGREFAATVRQHDAQAHLPVLLLATPQNVMTGMDVAGGGIDILLAPFDANLLATLVRQRSEQQMELHSFSIRDTLTGLLNHASFLERVSAEHKRLKRHEYEAAYAVLAIDGIGAFPNPASRARDELKIKALARLLQQRLRRYDVVGRCGFNKFGVLLPYCSQDNAGKLLAALCTSFTETPLPAGPEASLHAVTQAQASFHASLVQLLPNVSVNETIEAANARVARSA